MLKTIKTSNLQWTSDDGKVRIWEFQTEDGVTGSTMSQAIGEGLNKQFDIISYKNAKGKEYWRQVPRDKGNGGFNENFTAARWAISTALDKSGELNDDAIVLAGRLLAEAKKLGGINES